jgi:hypothetical protein
MPENPTKIAAPASTQPGPQGRVEPQVIPQPAPTATPAPIDLAERNRQIIAEPNGDKRRAMAEQLRKDLLVEEGAEPEQEPEESSILTDTLRRYPDQGEAVAEHIQALVPLIPESMSVESFENVVNYAMKAGQGMKPDDRFDVTAPDAMTKCSTNLQKTWRRDYDGNMVKVQATVKALGEPFAQWLDSTRLGNDPAVLQAILMHGLSTSDQPVVRNSASAPLSKSGSPTRDEESDRLAAAAIEQWKKKGSPWAG